MLFKSGLGQKQGVGGWGRGGYVEWVGEGGVCGVGGWGGGGKGWVGGGGGWGVGGGVGYPPLTTHPPLRFTREQTRVEYIRRCRLNINSNGNNFVSRTFVTQKVLSVCHKSLAQSRVSYCCQRVLALILDG